MKNNNLPALTLGLLLTIGANCEADVFRWDSGELIPSTEGIVPLPGVQLSRLQLNYADLNRMDLTLANLEGADLSQADLRNTTLNAATLAEANLTAANLTGAFLAGADLTATDLTGATVAQAQLAGATNQGLTLEQLYSTNSYQSRNLRGIGLSDNELTGVNLRNQDLSNAYLARTTLQDADLQGSDLAHVSLRGARLAGASFNDAIIDNVNLTGTTPYGFAKAQLYSTANYQDGDLRGVQLAANDLTNWDFSNQDLTAAVFNDSALTGVDFSGAVVVAAGLSNTTNDGLTKESLYSTSSYQSRTLEGIQLSDNNLSGWDFRGQNLRGAKLYGADLTGADLSQTDLSSVYLRRTTLTGADLTDAVIGKTVFRGSGLTELQFRSTSSFKSKDLTEVDFAELDLSGWDFSEQDLTRAIFIQATLAGSSFAQAVVNGASFAGTDITSEQLYSTRSYQQKELGAINLNRNDITDWDFSGQHLVGANFKGARLVRTNFSHANMQNAQFESTRDLGYPWNGATWFSESDFTAADLRGALAFHANSRMITRNTILPDGTVEGLSLSSGELLTVNDHELGITIEQGMTVAEDATLRIVVEDSKWQSVLQFGDSAELNLDGTLDLRIGHTTNPALLVGAPIELFAWSQPLDASNRFRTISYDTEAIWDVSQLYESGVATLTGWTAVPEPSNGFSLTPLLAYLFLIGHRSNGTPRQKKNCEKKLRLGYLILPGLALLFVQPKCVQAGIILNSDGLSRGTRWDASRRMVSGVERSLAGGLRYSLQGGSYESYRDLFQWMEPVPTVDQFRRAVENAFDVWTVPDPQTGLTTDLRFVPDFSTPVDDAVVGGTRMGAEIDLLASDFGQGSVAMQLFSHTGRSLKLTSGTENYGSPAITGSDIWMNSHSGQRWNLPRFSRVLAHEIGHSIGLGDLEEATNAPLFVDDDFDNTSDNTALATLTNSWALLVDPFNPSASPLGLFQLGRRHGITTDGVNLLMESFGQGNVPGHGEELIQPLSNDEFGSRQFLYPSTTRILDGQRFTLTESGNWTSHVPEPSAVTLFATGILLLRIQHQGRRSLRKTSQPTLTNENTP